ncbi:hypothetical protein EJB05_48907, partial [Eragrostis curvula]
MAAVVEALEDMAVTVRLWPAVAYRNAISAKIHTDLEDRRRRARLVGDDQGRQGRHRARSASASTDPMVEEAPVVKAAPNRCAECRKKVGLLGFACRCGGTFCSVHRYAEKHACDFDFKSADREQIAKNNPLVVAPKINKI